ncbi:MAG: histidinol-phosphatase (PHP family) [Verrucomicrobiales bacterium]|jgi:histidinol-phosphatase (PHP family)
MKIADYHTHTPLCQHAVGEPTDYAARAEKIGLLEIGFSDHSPMPDDDFDDWRMKLAEFPDYLAKVEQARVDNPNIPIKLGLEVDYLEGGDDWIRELTSMADYDYLIGSVHYIAPGWDIDNPEWIGRWKDKATVAEIWDDYWRIYTRCIASGHFDILAHPDLPKKFGFRPEGALAHYYEPAIAAAAEADICFEINTAGLRKEVAEMYPSREFLTLAQAAGIPLVISSDAHAPEEVGADFGQAAALAREVGYTELATFERRQRGSMALPGS